jgi:uncharacterized protein YdaU (DUF1376 family)
MSKAWMPFYGGDFIGNTLHLSRGELGSYILLLWHHWEHGSLPADEAELRRIARVHDHNHWPSVWRALRGFFHAAPDSPGRIVQGRLEAELSKSAKISNKRKDAAKQMHERKRANAEQKHTQSQSQSQRKKDAAGAAPESQEKQLFERGREVLGDSAGGLIAKLLKSKNRDIALARAAIETASTKSKPREYIGAVIAGGAPSGNGRRLTADEEFYGSDATPGII